MAWCGFLCHKAVMGQVYKAGRLFAAVTILIMSTGCGQMLDYIDFWNHLGDSDNNGTETGRPAEDKRAIEPASTYAVAIGGVAYGRDEIVIFENEEKRDFGSSTLDFKANNDNIELTYRNDASDFASQSGALIIPKKVGGTYVSYTIDGKTQPEVFKVIVPPQKLIQILIGEARGEMAAEAQIENGFVADNSVSPTANAIASVIRNRVDLTAASSDFDLFWVDETKWNENPPESYWDAVIEAELDGYYQFSPVDPTNSSFATYLVTDNRFDLLNIDELIAYDQAVVTAAGIFSNEFIDPTNGAFAFKTPTTAEALCLKTALNNAFTYLPEGCGVSDENFPAFAPVQVLIHPAVGVLENGDPSFIFIRNRSEEEAAVTNVP